MGTKTGWRKRRADKRSAKLLWKQAHALQDALPYYDGDIDTLKRAIEKRQDGRPIQIYILRSSLGQQTGLWIPFPDCDFIFISGDLSEGLTRQTILHELAHIAWKHEPIHLETRLNEAGAEHTLHQARNARTPDEAANALIPIIEDLFADHDNTTDNPLVCGRAKDDFATLPEQQAEALSRLWIADEIHTLKHPADAVFGSY